MGSQFRGALRCAAALPTTPRCGKTGLQLGAICDCGLSA
jgi:hypothetical protein